MQPLAPGDIQVCTIVAVKATEQYPLTQEERERLEPSIKMWDMNTLHNFMCWEHDKLSLFGADPVFFEFRLVEDGQNLNFNPLYYSPDEETCYCVVTNGCDSGVIMTLSHEKWYILACVGVHRIMDQLKQRGFLPWSEFQSQDRTTQRQNIEGADEANEAQSDDDYWDRYDNDGQQESDSQETGQTQPSKQTNTRAFVKSHCMHTIKDIYMLYSTEGKSTQQYANDIFASVATMYRGCTLSGTPLSQYVQRAVQNELRLYEQVELDLQVFLADVEVSLLELDFQVLAKLG